MAMDLGTANTLVYLEGAGIVLNEPTMIALSEEGRVLAVGSAAKSYWGRTPQGIRALRPMKDGVIEDFHAVSRLIKVFLQSAMEIKGGLSPRIVVCVPSDMTQVEKKTVLEASACSGTKKIYLLEETLAAAIGTGISVGSGDPGMVVDVGGGTTEVAVISNWAFDHCESIRVAGDEMDEAIVKWVLKQKGLRIGSGTAESIKWKIGCASPAEAASLECSISGKDTISGLPRTVTIKAAELVPAFLGPLEAIVSVIESVLMALTPETRHIVEQDLVAVVGGGALLRGFLSFLHDRTGLNYMLDSDPMTTVVRGAGQAIENFRQFRKVFSN